MKDSETSAKNAKTKDGFTQEERAAMKERAKELRAETESRDARAEGESAILEKIAEMPDADRKLAERIHAIVTEHAPELVPKTWYGMPAYTRNGKVVCFFQSSQKFKARYATLGFDEAANLDDGNMWPTAYALTQLTPADEKRIIELVKKAVS
jgi:uncharacterized protein YdhG (YjbR/CyaY superfamily)